MVNAGVRGGVRPRRLYNQAQRSKKEILNCPWCCRHTFKWVSLGVWRCTKCGFSQAGNAVSLN